MNNWFDLCAALAIFTMRPLAVTFLLPILGRQVLGGALPRNVIAVMIALPNCFAAYPDFHVLRTSSMMAWLGAVGWELFIGFCIGFVAALPLFAVEMTGQLIDTVRGAGIAEIMNPMLGAQTSIFGVYYQQLFGAIFIVNGGLAQVIKSIYLSYTWLPVGQPLRLTGHFSAVLLAQFDAIIALSVTYALPAVTLMVTVDIALGLINRSSEQLDVFFLAMPLKSVLACALIALTMSFSVARFVDSIHQSIAVLSRAFS